MKIFIHKLTQKGLKEARRSRFNANCENNSRICNFVWQIRCSNALAKQNYKYAAASRFSNLSLRPLRSLREKTLLGNRVRSAFLKSVLICEIYGLKIL
jgi:hypothetical protein